MRRYESDVRTARADETRRRIAEAARARFVSHGWGRTTVRDVARDAGVSVPTVYAVYGNKKSLAMALMDAADLAADPGRLHSDLAAAGSVPARQIAASVAFDRRLFERSGDVLALLHDAGRTEPDLAEVAREGVRRGDAARLAVFGGWPPGTLRDGLDARSAADAYAAICTLAAWTDLTASRGWPPGRVQEWWTAVLTRELLRRPG